MKRFWSEIDFDYRRRRNAVEVGLSLSGSDCGRPEQTCFNSHRHTCKPEET